MSKLFLPYSCFILFILLIRLNGILAQEPIEKSDIQEEFKQAKVFLLSFKNDSALLILDRLVDELASTNQLNTPFGIRVQFRQAEALEKDHKDEIAISKLLHVVEISKTYEQWDILAHAHLSLARLYEKINRPKSCLLNLDEARIVIDQHKVDSLYPRFSIRISSYHRIFDNVDSSIHYAKEVLRTAPIYNLFEEEAVGHLLMGMLLSKSSFETAIGHYSEAGKVWKQLEDFTGYGYTQNNLSRLYFSNGKLQEALKYNDSTLVAAAKSVAAGHDDFSLFYTSYKHRAHIFNALGKPDSAWLYIKKGYDIQLDQLRQENNEKVIEIDARYKDGKRIEMIAEQEKLILYEKERRYALIGIVLMTLVFLTILSYYYIKLRKANQKTRVQALTIIKNNKDLSKSLKRQVMLQSEVHHRVKNNLQIIISLLDLQKDEVNDIKTQDSLEAMSGRIYSMAAIHEILYRQEDMASVNLFDYIENLCMHSSNFSIEEQKPVFNIDIENHFFNLETSMPIGIMVTELLTNSLKYARVKDKKLEIFIAVTRIGESYCLSYKDNGPGFTKTKRDKDNEGLGTYLLKSMCRQLNGYMEVKTNKGASYQIFFKEKNNPTK